MPHRSHTEALRREGEGRCETGGIMLNTETVLTTIAGHLAGVGLAQYHPDGSGYLNHPDLPGVLFADADTPDTALVLTCTNQDDGPGQYDIEFTWRATGITPNGVSTMADNTFEHFRSVLGVKAEAAVWQAGTIIELPSLILPGLLEWSEAQRITRGTGETTSPAKHNGARFVRRDIYRMTMVAQ
jgi:hypothetical protein